jgi:hypothetical protein
MTTEKKADEPKAAPKSEKADEPEATPNVIDDGVQDVELGPPRLGGWVDIVAGEYAGRHAAYLDNVEVDDQGVPITVSVRTRDADNLVLDLAYEDISSTTYAGGR